MPAQGNTVSSLGGNWATVDTKLCLGYRSNTHRDTFRGQVGEVLLFNRLLSETEHADVEDYLVNKWTRRNGTDGAFSGVTFAAGAQYRLTLSGATFCAPASAARAFF